MSGVPALVFALAAAVCAGGCLAADPIAVHVNTSGATHTINPLFLGCHTDLGFAHEQLGFYSQMIYGESFEFGLNSSWDYKPNSYDKVPAAATPGGLRWNRIGTTGAVTFDVRPPGNVAWWGTHVPAGNIISTGVRRRTMCVYLALTFFHVAGSPRRPTTDTLR